MAAVHAPRDRGRGRRRPGDPRELLRGRRLRTMARRAAAHRVRVGARRDRSVARRAVRARAPTGHLGRRLLRVRVAVDPERVRPVSGLPCRGRCGRRVQREVHGEPAGPARWRLDHPDGPHPTTYRTSSPRHRGGPTRGSDLHGTRDERHERHGRRAARPRRDARRARPGREQGAPRDAEDAPERLVLRRRRQRPVRPDHAARGAPRRERSARCSRRTPWRSRSPPRRPRSSARRAGTCTKTRILLDALTGPGRCATTWPWTSPTRRSWRRQRRSPRRTRASR